MENYDGVPVWHASVCNGRGALPFWSRAERRLARRYAHEALIGVGVKPDLWEEGEVAIHLRRHVRPSESLIVGPARDIRGTEEEQRRLLVVAGEVSPQVRHALGLTSGFPDRCNNNERNET